MKGVDMNRKTYIIFVLMIIIAGGVIDNSSIVNNNIVPGVIGSFDGATETGIGKDNNQKLKPQDCIQNCLEKFYFSNINPMTADQICKEWCQ